MPNWKKLIVSGSDANLNSLDVTQNISAFSVTASAFTGSLQGTASIADKVTGGTLRYIPLWTGSSANELTSSIMYQTTKGIFIGYDTSSHFHSAEGETLALHSGDTGVKNVLYAHGASNDSYRVNIRNISSGVSASTNFIATADVGNDAGGYVRVGINSSTYVRTDEIGGALDAFLFTTGSDLLIGNLSPDKNIVLFTGPGNADTNARVFINPTGSVGINTSIFDLDAPDALRVQSLNQTTYNVITALGETDNYLQLNVKNTKSSAASASSDIVATADNGTELTNYIDMGINSSQYSIANAIGSANDAYLYSTGQMLHIGNATAGQQIMFFVGDFDAEASKKFILDSNDEHSLIGNIGFTGSVNVTENLTVGGTLVAEKFLTEYITSSVIYESGSTKFGDTSDDLHQFTGSLSVLGNISGSLVLPSGIVSSSSQINTGSFTGSFDGLFTGQVIGTSSWAVNAITASYVESLVLPNNIVTASSQIDHNLTTNYVADQHIDHTVVSIIAGDGLVGGGNISASRTLTLDTGSLHFLNAIKNKLNIEGVISSSTQFQDNLFNIDTYEFVTDGVQNTFNLTNQYDSSSLIVTVDGLTFSPIDDYTVSSTNIVFTSPLVSESLILVRAFVNASDAVGTFTGSLLGTASYATNALSASWAPGGSAIAVLDEGSQLTSTVTSLNFVGTGVSASNVGDAVTITVSGGGGGVTFAEVLKAVSLRI